MKKTSTGNAFDDILYNSDSDLESDGDEDEAPQQAKSGRQQKAGKKDKKRDANASYIRNEGDEPMDLLSRSIAGNVACESERPYLSRFAG